MVAKLSMSIFSFRPARKRGHPFFRNQRANLNLLSKYQKCKEITIKGDSKPTGVTVNICVAQEKIATS